jgi:hypothetical protein
MKISNEDTYEKLPREERETAVITEMLPFVILAAIPIFLTILIAKVFGPSF